MTDNVTTKKNSALIYKSTERCTDTSDLRHFGPKTWDTLAPVPKCLGTLRHHYYFIWPKNRTT